jgi:hypothetical protein
MRFELSMIRPLIAALLAAGSSFAAASSLEQPLLMSLTSVYRDLSYVRDGGPRQRLDLYVPTPPVPRVWGKPLTTVTRRLPLIVSCTGLAFGEPVKSTFGQTRRQHEGNRRWRSELLE